MLALESMSADDGPSRTAPPAGSRGGVVHGPLWYRQRIRRWGPLLACVLPAVLFGTSRLVRTLFEGRARGWASVVLDVCAAPGLLAVGAPLATSAERPVGLAISVVLWLFVGFAAARVATRNPVATFGDFWRANWWLTGAVFVGAVLAIVIVAVVLGRQLL